MSKSFTELVREMNRLEEARTKGQRVTIGREDAVKKSTKRRKQHNPVFEPEGDKK